VRRIWSLWEIIHILATLELTSTLRLLQTVLISFGREGSSLRDPDQAKLEFQNLVDKAREACSLSGFSEAAQSLTFIFNSLNSNQPRTASSLATEARHACEQIQLALENRVFLSLPKSRIDMLGNKNFLGESVSAAFPSAVEDIEESGNCLALECSTAAVFHLMRVVEWGLRALARSLGVKSIKANNKPGNKNYRPLEYSEWEKIIGELQERIESKLAKAKRGPAKQRLQEFYFPALQDIRAFKDAWRNHVMHTRASYTAADAEAVFSHVKRFMQSLATQVTET
jgi:hypothetical protein